MSRLRDQHMPVMWHDISASEKDTPAASSSLNDKAGLIGRMALMMLSYGAGAFRVRAAMNKLSRALNITTNASIGIKAVEYTCISGDQTCTNALSNVTYGVNTEKLHYMEIFCDGFTERADRYSIDDFHRMLDTIHKAKSGYSTGILCLASGVACAAFAFLLGAGYTEMLITFFAAFAGFLVRKVLIDRKITLFANVSLAVFAACITYIVIVRMCEYAFSVPFTCRSGYICSMLFVIPGFPLITGGIDLAKLDLRSGLFRTTYSVLVIGVATLTCALSSSLFHFAPSEFDEYYIPFAVKLLLRLVFSFAGVFGFSMLFKSTKRMALTAGIIGSVANTMRLILVDMEISPAVAAFVCALAAGLMASAIKRYIGFPRITLTVPSIVIMVPGMLMYKGMFYLAQNDFATGQAWLLKAFLIVIALPLGLVFARILTDPNFRKVS